MDTGSIAIYQTIGIISNNTYIQRFLRHTLASKDALVPDHRHTHDAEQPSYTYLYTHTHSPLNEAWDNKGSSQI